LNLASGLKNRKERKFKGGKGRKASAERMKKKRVSGKGGNELPTRRTGLKSIRLPKAKKKKREGGGRWLKKKGGGHKSTSATQK